MSPRGVTGLHSWKLRALEERIPLAVHLELTHECSLRCPFCYNHSSENTTPLNLSEWESVLDDLRSIGTLLVTLTGGDPLKHPDFLEIAQAARHRHLAVKIFTNGMLIDRPMADAIASLPPLQVELSIHGAGPEIHDRTTGVDGSYSTLRRAIDLLRERNIEVALRMPLSTINQSEFVRVIEHSRKEAIPLLVDPMITVKDNRDRAPLRFQADGEAVRSLFGLLAETGDVPTTDRRLGDINCGLGSITLAVDPAGWVFPCLQWRHSSMGNIREQGLKTIWEESPVRSEATDVARKANDHLVGLGGSPASYPFCPAEAILREGDPIRPSRQFFELAAAAAEARSQA
ncbi:MAG: hypothetical protein DRJ65_07780 [Acidobacteria bacterium]|nr:MAG: hypothetical protein DRJ65_07780 [Acidobacteriota bacterium]